MVRSARMLKFLALFLLIAGCTTPTQAATSKHVSSKPQAVQVASPAAKPTIPPFSILDVQKEYARLNIPFGVYDGLDGPRTQNARCAFAYLTHLSGRRQTPSPADLARLRATKMLPAPVERNVTPVYLVVNQSCQMAFLVENHKLIRIYAVSTGFAPTGKHHTYDGRFSIINKQRGDHHSTLYPEAILHYPMQFSPRGDELHGYTSVPSHNASHGCIRFSYGDIEQLFPIMHIGDSVIVIGDYPKNN